MPRQRNEYPRQHASLLSTTTQAGFDRGIRRAMSGIKGSAAPLRRVIATVMSELRERSMDTAAALAHLNVMVEDAGRGGPGDRISLMSGQPRWMAVRDQVLADARTTPFPAPTA
jgi:hypothetical protein